MFCFYLFFTSVVVFVVVVVVVVERQTAKGCKNFVCGPVCVCFLLALCACGRV